MKVDENMVSRDFICLFQATEILVKFFFFSADLQKFGLIYCVIVLVVFSQISGDKSTVCNTRAVYNFVTYTDTHDSLVGCES